MKAGFAQPDQAGFTLFEILVALAILGMLAGMLMAGIKGVALSQRGLAHGQADTDEVAGTQARLRSVLERLRPEKRLDSATSLIDVRGTEHDLAFFAPAQAADGLDELKRYRLLLTATGDLVLYTANGLDERIDLNAPGLVGWQPIPLLHGVTQIHLAYFGPDPVVPERTWQVGWYDRPQAPDLVRIRVEFAPGDKRHWPDLLVRPSATANAPCRVNPATGRCGAK